MKEELKIQSKNTIQLNLISKDGRNTYATIKYEKGQWKIKPTNSNYTVKVNCNLVTDSITLEKYDVIEARGNKFHWSDYLIEERNQTLYKKDFLNFHGRVNKTNYRALLLLIIGLIPIIYLSPGLILLSRRGRNLRPNEDIELIQSIGPYVHIIGFTVLLYLTIILSIKRMRDTGNKLNNLLIPVWNLKILLFNNSEHLNYDRRK